MLMTFMMTIVLMFCHSHAQNQPNVDFKNLVQDQATWWAYHTSSKIVLSSDFIATDNESKPISKDAFLSKLTTGAYIPIKLNSNEGSHRYQLYKLDETADTSISKTIQYISTNAYKNFKMEGKAFPTFRFNDLNGNEYTNANTKGKILVIKCWFIGCAACVAEFPELNELVTKYQNRKDVAFVSLALDKPEKLTAFLLKKPFRYAVVANQTQFMGEELAISAYPTHIIVDKEGAIRKVVYNAHEMLEALEYVDSGKTIAKQASPSTLPPPPPPVMFAK
jgi:thiol-disulfide isomerase/thioredoxin